MPKSRHLDPLDQPLPDLPLDTSGMSDDPGDDEVLASLGKALEGLAKAKRGRKQRMAEVVKVLEQLDPRDYPELADHPAITKILDTLSEQAAQNADVPPGTIIGTGMAAHKKPWTMADVGPGKVEWLRFTPLETLPVTYNGLRFQLFADEEFYGPKFVYDIYAEHKRALKVAHEHAGLMFKTTDRVSDPTVINEATMRIRAMTEHIPGQPGGFLPGAGIGPIFVQGEGEGEGGEGGKAE